MTSDSIDRSEALTGGEGTVVSCWVGSREDCDDSIAVRFAVSGGVGVMEQLANVRDVR
jgi:hypothetical protein